MSKKLFVSITILVVIGLMSSSLALAANEVVYKLQYDEPRLQEADILGRTFTSVSMKGAFTIGEWVGEPTFQATPLKLLLPQGTEVTGIEIETGGAVEVNALAQGFDLKNDRPITPYQPPVPIGQAYPTTLEMKAGAYKSTSAYPSNLYSDVGVGYCRGYAILTMNVYPTQYIAGEGKLYYYPEMTVRVNLERTGEINEFYRPNNGSDRRHVRSLVDNPEMIDNYGGSGPRVTEYPGGLCDPSHNGGLGYDYVVIVREALFNYSGTYTWDSLLARKEAQGLEATKVTIEDIDACMDYHHPDPLFNDTPAHIREFMKDAYEDWGTEYVLVAGDQDGTNRVQRRLMDYAYEGNCESDLYWSNLDSNFNADHDNDWGEEGDTGFDLYSELFLGSIPCDVGQDISNWMTKCFYYEDEEDRDYLENASFYGGNTGWDCEGDDFIDYSAIMGLDYWSGPIPEPYPSWLDFQYGFETWNEENPGNEYNMEVKWTAEPPNPGGWQGGSENAAITGMRNAINADDVTLISAIAHANENMSMDVYYYTWESSYHNTRPFLVHDYGCHCGDMDATDDGVLHSMLFHSDTELAFGTIYNTGYGWGNYSSTKSSSALQQKSFWDYMFDYGNSGGPDFWQLGRAQAWSKDLMAPTINWDPGYGTWRGIIETCLLFSDPALTIKPPEVGEYLAFTHPDGLPEMVDPNGGTTVRVQVSEGQVSGSGMFYYDVGAGYTSVPMTEVEPNIYEAVFPPVTCEDIVDYYFSAQHNNGEIFYDPRTAPDRHYSALSALGRIIIWEDDFETNRGWTVESENLTAGEWERGVPVGQGERGDPPTDYDSSGNCYLTDNRYGDSDVDGGPTMVISPDIDLSDYDAAMFSYARWFYNDDGDDSMVVSISSDGGNTWTRVANVFNEGYWVVHEFQIADYVDLTDQFKFRMSVADNPNNSVTEAGLDAVKIFIYDCGELPDVSIAMVPDDPPITVPRGGHFTYTGILINNTASSVRKDVWLMLDVPGYGSYGPLRRYNNVPLNPNQTFSRAGIRQNIPGYAPLGVYTYIAHCGDYPSVKEDSALFNFTVVAGDGGDAGDWDLFGWFDDPGEALPMVTQLYGNYPNPFNPATTFSYGLANDSKVKLEVFNLMGQRVETLIDGNQKAGYHKVQWDASRYASGVYFYKLAADGEVFTKRMTLIK